MFKGYCFVEVNGSYCPAVELKDAQAAVAYVNLQKNIFPEVRIVDEDEYIVLHAVDGEIIFPKKE